MWWPIGIAALLLLVLDDRSSCWIAGFAAE